MLFMVYSWEFMGIHVLIRCVASAFQGEKHARGKKDKQDKYGNLPDTQ